MANTDRSVVTFPDAEDLELVRHAAQRLGLKPATFLRMAGIERARLVLKTHPEDRPEGQLPASAK